MTLFFSTAFAFTEIENAKKTNKKIIVTPVSEVHLSNDVDEAEELTEEELQGVWTVALHRLLMKASHYKRFCL